MFGGSAWESNPPGTVLAPHTGFEVRELHQTAAHFRISERVIIALIAAIFSSRKHESTKTGNFFSVFRMLTLS